MFIARYLQRSSWLTLRRYIRLSNRSSAPPKKLWKKVKSFLIEDDKSNFDEEWIAEAHRSDGINVEEWMLIYRDQGASRSFLLVAVTFPTFLIAAAIMAYDTYNNEFRNRFQVVQRLSSDLEELGIYAVLPGIALLIVISILLRLHHLRLLRIYQNRMNGDKYVAIGSRNVVQKRQIPFERKCASACYLSYEQTQLTGLVMELLIGNIQVNKQRFIIHDDAFRANNYRTYMLNETSTMPRL